MYSDLYSTALPPAAASAVFTPHTVQYCTGVSLLTDTDAIYNVALCLFQLSTWAEMQSLTGQNVALVICEPRV